MKLLLVHQNFPGQFRDLGPALCDRGHELKRRSAAVSDRRIHALKCCATNTCSRTDQDCILSLEVDEWIRRSEKVANLAMSLKKRGWAPDVMLAHPGWGEALPTKTGVSVNTSCNLAGAVAAPEHLGIDPVE